MALISADKFKGCCDMIIMAPISIGELFDKITILRVKQSKLTDPDKLKNVSFELEQLEELANSKVEINTELVNLIDSLHEINAELWDIEDGKRQCEREKLFDDRFITLARQVYIKNDTRASIKRSINNLLGSTIFEEKSYDKY